MKSSTIKIIIFTYSVFINYNLFGQTIIEQIDSKRDTIYIKGRCTDVKHDQIKDIYLLNEKPINGLLFCNDTIIIENKGFRETRKVDYSVYYRNGKVVLKSNFHKNGKLNYQIEYDENNYLKYPIKFFNEEGYLSQELKLLKDSNILNLGYEYFLPESDSLIYVNYSISKHNNELFKTYMNVSDFYKLPININSVYKIYELSDGLNIDFNFENNFEISRVQYFVAEVNNEKKRDVSSLFQNDEIEYYDDLKMKSIKRNYQDLKLNEFALFDENGNLIEFKIFSENKVYYSFKKK